MNFLQTKNQGKELEHFKGYITESLELGKKGYTQAHYACKGQYCVVCMFTDKQLDTE